jgi:DNA-binding NarL/FixJ family response regulator
VGAQRGSTRSLPVASMEVSESRLRVQLTCREREVLDLLCLRLTDPEIARYLSIGTRTVESHVARILDKLYVANRREAAVVAVQLGLV